VPIVLKSGSLNLLEPSGPVKGCNGMALPFIFTFSQHKNTVPTAQRTHCITEINPLTPELNPSAQRCMPRFFIWDFDV
jgi:hypothetical protein